MFLQSINLWDTLKSSQSFNHIANSHVAWTFELDLNKTDSIKYGTPVLSKKMFKYHCVKRPRQLQFQLRINFWEVTNLMWNNNTETECFFCQTRNKSFKAQRNYEGLITSLILSYWSGHFIASAVLTMTSTKKNVIPPFRIIHLHRPCLLKHSLFTHEIGDCD